MGGFIKLKIKAMNEPKTTTEVKPKTEVKFINEQKLRNEKKLENEQKILNNLKYSSVKHTFEPIYNIESKILILGTFPSVKSREIQFYYGHPQNRFWKVISSVLGCEIPQTFEEKTKMLLNNNIAIWDVIESCEIIGSSDSSIQNVIPNDLSTILNNSNIDKIYANGKTAAKLYEKYSEVSTKKPIITLPSTSPANAAFGLDRLAESWKIIKFR